MRVGPIWIIQRKLTYVFLPYLCSIMDIVFILQLFRDTPETIH
jgi:hypothetical protein